jgi:protein phosphatase
MLEAFGLTDLGCVRANNEDALLLAPDIGLYMLADGMGGASGGEKASKLAVETVAEVLREGWERNLEALLEAFEEANRRVRSAAERDPTLRGMGTTLVAALEEDQEVLIASVGDSRAYIHENGCLEAVTEDQTWVHEVGRRLGIGDEALRTHPMRHVLTMAIGVGERLRIHSYRLRPAAGAHILLCSDGLHGVLDTSVIAEVIKSPISLEAKCHYLLEAARKAGGPDNITAVLLRSV